MVESRFATVRLIRAGQNLGGAARTMGVLQARSETVAFCDDDSFWEPGSLDGALRLLGANGKLGLIAGQVLLGQTGRPDPTCQEMQCSPLPAIPGLPYPRVLGFIACGAVVRRNAYLQAGGFHPRFGIGGEEELLSLDLAAHGWELVYAPDIVARHFPSPVRDVDRRRAVVTRNALWVSWLRDAPRDALSATYRALGRAREDAAALEGLGSAVAGLPWVARERRRLPGRVQIARRMLSQRL
jgi:GT2 family glycosyltransferase